MERESISRKCRQRKKEDTGQVWGITSFRDWIEEEKASFEYTEEEGCTWNNQKNILFSMMHSNHSLG